MKRNANKSWAPKPEVTRTPTTAYTSKNTQRAGGFMSAMETTRAQVYNLTYTENGAIAHSTTGSKLLDMNWAISSLRGKSDKEIYTMFRDAFNKVQNSGSNRDFGTTKAAKVYFVQNVAQPYHVTLKTRYHLRL